MTPIGFVLPALGIGLGALLIRPQRGFFTAGSADDPAHAIPILIPQATIEEQHHHELEITEHPIEMGAPIADHAFKRPAIIRIRAAWSNSPSQDGGIIGTAVAVGVAVGGRSAGVLAAVGASIGAIRTIGSILTGNSPSQVREIFDALLALQEARAPFDVFTGKKAYRDMLLRSITEDTNQKTENALVVSMVCQQVIITATRLASSVASNPSVMESPELNAPSLDLGDQNLQAAPSFQIPTFDLGDFPSVGDFG